MAETSLLKKIMALLAKAESSTFEEESSAYLAKAQELMVIHAIEEADLKPEEREKVTSKVVSVSNSTTDHSLMWLISKPVGVQALRNTRRASGAGRYEFTLVGFPADIAFVEALFASLLLQRETALVHAVMPYWESARSWNRSFRIGYAARVRERLIAARKKTEDDTGPGTALVLADRGQLAKVECQRLFPNVKKVSVTATGSGRGAGRNAAETADLSGGQRNLGSNRRVLA